MLTVKPGITGAWQTEGRSHVDFVPRVKIEATYAERRSILYDFWIMLKTPFKVLHQEGVV
jgi:lipopolysaccharide/colanic/teichoic acid biosynthesis glycosyltransferase